LEFIFHGTKAPIGPQPPHYRGFTIALRHTTLGRTVRNLIILVTNMATVRNLELTATTLTDTFVF